MNATRAFALIKTELERLDPALLGNETDDNYRAGVVLLAAVWVIGTDIEQLATFTGYDPDFVAAISLRMLKSGLWEESGLVHSDHWFHEDCYSTQPFGVMSWSDWACCLPNRLVVATSATGPMTTTTPHRAS
jgi:hypothetical protein